MSLKNAFAEAPYQCRLHFRRRRPFEAITTIHLLDLFAYVTMNRLSEYFKTSLVALTGPKGNINKLRHRFCSIACRIQ